MSTHLKWSCCRGVAYLSGCGVAFGEFFKNLRPRGGVHLFKIVLPSGRRPGKPRLCFFLCRGAYVALFPTKKQKSPFCTKRNTDPDTACHSDIKKMQQSARRPTFQSVKISVSGSMQARSSVEAGSRHHPAGVEAASRQGRCRIEARSRHCRGIQSFKVPGFQG